jgi:hypothetical protein
MSLCEFNTCGLEVKTKNRFIVKHYRIRDAWLTERGWIGIRLPAKKLRKLLKEAKSCHKK